MNITKVAGYVGAVYGSLELYLDMPIETQNYVTQICTDVHTEGALLS